MSCRGLVGLSLSTDDLRLGSPTAMSGKRRCCCMLVNLHQRSSAHCKHPMIYRCPHACAEASATVEASGPSASAAEAMPAHQARQPEVEDLKTEAAAADAASSPTIAASVSPEVPTVPAEQSRWDPCCVCNNSISRTILTRSAVCVCVTIAWHESNRSSPVAYCFHDICFCTTLAPIQACGR